MALTFVINIKAHAGGAHFAPPTQKVDTGDVITWSNNDQVNAHWPGLTATANGPVTDPTFFMANQIAPDSSSDDFRPGTPGTYHYACSLHANERGTLVVS